MNKFSNPKNRKGFTLVEILTVVFLGTLIIIAAYTVYIISYKAYKKNSASSELTQNGRIALERITRDLRQATEIVTDLPESPGEGTPGTEIMFQDGHATAVIQYIRYYLSGTDLHREQRHYYFPSDPNTWVTSSAQDEDGNPPLYTTDSDQVKAEKISSLQFWGEETITLRLSVADSQSTYTFETKTLARNDQ